MANGDPETSLPVDEWLPFMRALLDEGLPVPLVVLAFMHYQLGHIRFGDAVSSVANVVGRSRDDVLAEVCLACTSPENAGVLSRQLLELAPKLDAMKGLERGEGMIPSAEGIERFWRRAGLHNELPIYRPPAHPEWTRILRLLRDEGFGAMALQHAVWRYTVTTDSEGTLPVLRPSQAEETVASAMSLGTEALEPMILRGAQELMENPEGIAELRQRIRTSLERVSGVLSVAEAQRAGTPPDVFVAAKGRASLEPPWVTFPEAPTSMRWRMGPGEDHMDQWIRLMSQLGPGGRRQYLEEHPPPDVWLRWLERVDEVLWPPVAES